MKFEEFKQQLHPDDFMLDNLWATMEKCFKAGKDDMSASYNKAIVKAAEKHTELNVHPKLFLCNVFAELHKE